MAQETVLAPASELLPEAFADPAVRAMLSSDGQIYVRQRDGDGEVRVESWALLRLRETDKQEIADLDDHWTKRIVRHLRHERLHCADCGHDETSIHFPWSERRCPACWSLRVDTMGAEEIPERPAQFANIGEPFLSWHNVNRKKDTEKHVWGLSAYEDARALIALLGSYRQAPDGQAHLYLLMLFAETLVQHPQHIASEDYFNLVLNFGNIAQRYFVLTGAAEGARKMLDQFERAGLIREDPVSVSLAKHSFGMAVIYLLDVLDEPQAELQVGRPGVRKTAIEGLYAALDELEKVRDRDGATQQRHRIEYAIADLLRRGRASDEDRAEAIRLFERLPIAEMAAPLQIFVETAKAENLLTVGLPAEPSEDALDRCSNALKILISTIRAPTPLKLKFRWRWALAVGRFLLLNAGWREALPFLQSAVTFILKDTPFRTDPQTVTSDSERYHQAFSLLAGVYVSIGWWFEALSLLETYRGRVLDVASLTGEERVHRREEAEQSRDDKFYGMSAADDSPNLILAEEASWEEMHGTTFGPFDDDYELPDLSDRILTLFEQLQDEDTVLISFSIDDIGLPGQQLLSAIVIGPPVKPARPAKYRTWKLSNAEIDALTSDIYGRPSSFRERRLGTLGALIFSHLLQPIVEDLQFFTCLRALIVAPSRLSNLPFETYRTTETSPEGLPKHVAFMPSLMLNARREAHSRSAGRGKLLIVGYEGSDLIHADDEAQLLCELFGDRALYLSGRNCTKKSVIDALNQDYDYVHFICHGTYDRDHPRESSLYFRDSWDADAFRLRARELREFVRLSRRPVVTLSACSTALTADSRSNTWHGLPGSLLEIGAHCVIGTRWPVADRVASTMMVNFYRLLLLADRTPLQCFHAMQDDARDDGLIEEWACFGYLGLP